MPDADFVTVHQGSARRLSTDADRPAAPLRESSTGAHRRQIGAAASVAGLGRHFGALLHEAEVRYLVANEWAQTPEDVLHRRPNRELHMSADRAAAFADWFDAELAPGRLRDRRCRRPGRPSAHAFAHQIRW